MARWTRRARKSMLAAHEDRTHCLQQPAALKELEERRAMTTAAVGRTINRWIRTPTEEIRDAKKRLFSLFLYKTSTSSIYKIFSARGEK